MVTIKKLKSQVENANALGVANLTEKGVEVRENATPYEIMKKIADVSGGGGTEEIENLIDNSRVLDSTEGTVKEKVEELIGLVEENTLPDWDDNSPIIATGKGRTHSGICNTYWELTEKGTLKWKLVDENLTSGVSYFSMAGWTNTPKSFDYEQPEDFRDIAQKIKQIYVSDGFKCLYLYGATQCVRVRLPEGMKEVKLYHFQSLRDIDVSGVSTNVILQNCPILEKIALSDTQTILYSGSTQDCWGLKEVENLKNIVNFQGYNFVRCYKLSGDIVFNPNLTNIGTQAFAVTNINSITFQNSVDSLPTTISASAFGACNNLTDIYCPWAEGEVANAPWGATNATIHYNYVEGEETNAEG